MAVRVRLTRTGAKNSASYRIVAADVRSPRDGKCLEVLGWYDPKLEGSNCEIKLDRIYHWKKQGAKLSDTVRSLVNKVAKSAE